VFVHDQLSAAATALVGSAEQPLAAAGSPSEELRSEACNLLDQAQSEDRQERWKAAVVTGDLIDRARRALDGSVLAPTGFARVLRSVVLIRDLADVPDLPPEPLLDELITHTTQHGLASHNAAAQALRGVLAESRGDMDEAMDAAVNAMVTVELVHEPSLERVFASNDIATLLLHLGVVDLAVQMYATAAADSAAAGLPREHVITFANQVMSEIVHGLTLERAGDPDRARTLFAIAAEHGRQGLRTWHNLDKGLGVRDKNVAAFRSAIALVEFTDELEAQLRSHLTSPCLESRLVPGIVLARRLTETGRADQARALLAELTAWPRCSEAQPQLRIALARHLADLDTNHDINQDINQDTGLDADQATRHDSGFSHYVTVLESELWTQWKARGRDLRARLEHERLRRAHGPIRALAAEDPLTGLPNRRALDELLAELAAAACPGTVAMVDLDGLSVVNLTGSHADGDATLRAVAVAMRATLPGTDSVVRYGGDEFVVLMPHDDLTNAAAKVKRVVAAIAALPTDRGFGVRASAGVVLVEPHENADSILVRADNAMTQAKHGGGNQVRLG
jgi:diguanylate cyclase